MIERSVRWKRARQAEVRCCLRSYLSAHACVDCGEREAIVLEFDHVRGIKEANVSKLMQNGRSWAQVLKEIEKCEVVCANCHRKRSAARGRWWMLEALRARSVNSSIADS